VRKESLEKGEIKKMTPSAHTPEEWMIPKVLRVAWRCCSLGI